MQLSREMKSSIGYVSILIILIFCCFSWEHKVAIQGDILPTTNILGGEKGSSAIDMRKLGSPLLFSFPSEIGYSGAVHEEDNKIDITFVQTVQKERYFSPEWLTKSEVSPSEAVFIIPSMNQHADFEPVYPPVTPPPNKQRIVLRAPLHHRLLESPIFPDILSMKENRTWHARAFLQVSSLGFVEHLFLDQPLVSEPMNQALLRMLYGLRFTSGTPSEGWVDIYSPNRELEE